MARDPRRADDSVAAHFINDLPATGVDNYPPALIPPPRGMISFLGGQLYSGRGGQFPVSAEGQTVVILFLVFFLLASGDQYKRKLLKLAGPTLSEKKLSMQILREIDQQIGRFLLVQIFTSVVVSVVTWLALAYMGVNQPPVWGIVEGVLNSIPYFGAIMVSAGLAFVALIQFGTLHMPIAEILGDGSADSGAGAK